MKNDEKFLDKNIAELCEMYDKIHGANVNLSRITPDFIDGLKPVQRRTLYVMYLKDQGKTFRKVATISGDVFGRVHPHCLHPDTVFLLSDGRKMSIEEMYNNKSEQVFPTYSWEPHTNAIVKSTIWNVRLTKHVDAYHSIKLSDGGEIRCTNDHEILICSIDQNDDIPPTWIRADQLRPGMLVYGGVTDNASGNGRPVFSCRTITSIDVVSSPNLPMYDYTVEQYGNGAVYTSSLYNTDGVNQFVIVKNSPVSIEDALVNIAQEWHNTLPLVEGSGNFGTVSGDPAGASRYIKARLSEYARACFFDDWKESVVDMDLAYDEETMEPRYLPAKYPNVLLNGCLGIGYGLASNIPCYNFREVVEATMKLMADPDARIVLIPDSPTGADIIESDFARLSDHGNGTYSMRCKYEIDADTNTIRIIALPYQITVNTIRERIADIKEHDGLPELVNMSDMSGKDVDLRLHIRDDVNPYKFMRKLIASIAGLEKSYPVNITITNDYEAFDYSVRDLLKEWINWRREQKRVVVSHKRTTLLAEQRTNDVKIFLMSKNNLEDTIKIFRTNHTRADIEHALIERYRDSEIRMDSLQARTLSNLRLIDLSMDAYEACIKRRDELTKEINEVEQILREENGVDRLIIAELKDGVKRFGTPRKSNIVDRHISVKTAVHGACILQLSSDGNIIRKPTSNLYEEPIPADTNGFAVRVDNDAAFILIDENGYHSFVKVNDVPVDVEVPVNRYARQKINGNIVAMLPYDIDSDKCCTLISKHGIIKRIKIADMSASRKPCIDLKGDKLVRGIVTKIKSDKDLLIYTKDGMGQRLDPNSIRITSPLAKGGNGFKLHADDEIIGCYAINPVENQYLIYVTVKGKMRLNRIEYLPTRDSKHDKMVRLINLNDRDKLCAIIGCNKMDTMTVYYDNGDSEVIDINKMEESTMSSEPKKITEKQNAVTTSIVKCKIN